MGKKSPNCLTSFVPTRWFRACSIFVFARGFSPVVQCFKCERVSWNLLVLSCVSRWYLIGWDLFSDWWIVLQCVVSGYNWLDGKPIVNQDWPEGTTCSGSFTDAVLPPRTRYLRRLGLLVHVSLYEFAFVYVRGVRFAGKGERVAGRGGEGGLGDVVSPAHWLSRRTVRSVCVYLDPPHQDCHLQAMETKTNRKPNKFIKGLISFIFISQLLICLNECYRSYCELFICAHLVMFNPIKPKFLRTLDYQDWNLAVKTVVHNLLHAKIIVINSLYFFSK